MRDVHRAAGPARRTARILARSVPVVVAALASAAISSAAVAAPVSASAATAPAPVPVAALPTSFPTGRPSIAPQGDWLPPTLEDLLAHSTLVLEVRMHKGGALRDAATGHITTDWDMEVLEVLYPGSAADNASLRFRTSGGCIGNRCEVISGWPYFDEGERAVAFLCPSAADPARLETTSGPEGWFHADSVSAGLRAVWDEDERGDWTVGWAHCPGGGWVSRRTVWTAGGGGRRLGRHEMPIAELKSSIDALSAARQGLAREAR